MPPEPPRKRTIKRRTIPADFIRYLTEYLGTRSMREKSALLENDHKAVLMNVLTEVGTSGDGGHRTIMLDEPVTFYSYPSRHDKPTEKKVTGIQRQRRVGQSLDEDKTLALLESKGLLIECTTTVVVIEEDKVLAANFSGAITDEELKGLYTEKETFAFQLITE